MFKTNACTLGFIETREVLGVCWSEKDFRERQYSGLPATSNLILHDVSCQ